MDRFRTIRHKNSDIMFLDCAGNTKEEAYEILVQFTRAVKEKQDGTVLFLADFENAYHDLTLTSRWKELVEAHSSKVRRAAIVGVTGAFKVVVAAYRFWARFRGVAIDDIMRDFDNDIAAAKDWLVES